MSNQLYDHGLEAFLSASIDYGSDTLKFALCEAGYVADLVNHQFLSSVTNIAATTAALSSKTSVGGIANCASIVATAVTAGAAITQLVLYKDTGSSATSPLIAYWNVATNLPVTPNGTDITLTVDTGINKLFRI